MCLRNVMAPSVSYNGRTTRWREGRTRLFISCNTTLSWRMHFMHSIQCIYIFPPTLCRYHKAVEPTYCERKRCIHRIIITSHKFWGIWSEIFKPINKAISIPMRYQEDLAGYLKMKRVKKMDLNIYVLGILFDLKN